MFVVFLLRKRYGPPIVVLTGVALLAVGAGVTHHVATGVIGAALVVVGPAAAVIRKKRGDASRDRNEDLGR